MAFFDSDGTQTRFVDTGNYIPSAIAFAPDHTIWTSAGRANRTIIRRRSTRLSVNIRETASRSEPIFNGLCSHQDCNPAAVDFHGFKSRGAELG